MESGERVAIVTGGGRGIGKCIAKRFLEEGLTVVIAEIDKKTGKETEQELKGLGEVHFLQTDISREDSVKQTIGYAAKRFGRLDILVNNAGISLDKEVTLLSLDEWNEVVGTNLTGAFLCSKYAVPHLKKTRGVIVNISCTRAVVSKPHSEAYSASKGGIIALTHAMVSSLGPDIRVNCISPGWIEVDSCSNNGNGNGNGMNRYKPTEKDHKNHPAGRVGIPEDVSSLVYFLASPEASFITGANFIVDGGMTRKMQYM